MLSREDYIRTCEWFRREGAFFECSDATTPAAWHLPGGGYFLLSTVEECADFAEVREMVLGAVAV